MTTSLAISVGVCGESTLLVRDEHTASRVGSGRIRVLATPVMINVIEAAALACCEALLPEGHQSLGTSLNISHLAATPVGMRIVARATVAQVEGRKIRFAVKVHDQRDLIGEGTHDRVVVNVAKFDLRVQEKIQMLKEKLV
jgi:fluoroacetyl-CoA thioesterase